MQYLNCICSLCSAAEQKGLTVYLDIFCFLNNVTENIEVRGHGTQVPCKKDRAGGEGGREIMHRHQSSPDETPGAAETSAVEAVSSTSVTGFAEGHWGDTGPIGQWQVFCWWVLAAARCHPDLTVLCRFCCVTSPASS